MSDLDLEAIRARADAATAGPWRHVETGYGESVEVDDGMDGAQLFIETNGITYAWNGNNAEFITHAREDVPALVDEVESLRAKLTAVEALTGPVLDATADLTNWHSPNCHERHAGCLAMKVLTVIRSQEPPTGETDG